MGHKRDLIDVLSGDEFDQPSPFGLIYPVRTSDGGYPPDQRGRTWEYLLACGRDLRPTINS
ncbi:hypothetical protein KCV87_30255 [Actinosynnema pretiosum subsp. pretiosum]|uniref:Uncharacterized protein n=3 Tax=Actinosynnema TaxID=40566 RepID=C6WS44_ACTMD|nr:MULTISPECIES: hypothetical protein [Actinosynnema]ACU38864.1 hypothetical protein Amir_5042 [Actinosynnema mirum DSM 43827]ATE56105.1 hypothetical protein CNX65_24860 [Actinosynnema pretiosum]AXX32455.1 hypothetical protein APASM_5090 [Actinosynnema pretiosum subsp. pretiosum]QUF03622.1 hypothetical protein KCV87_30255 [Actinosynnema pretiosum subsp. pretiosum]